MGLDDGADGLFGRLAVHLKLITIEQLASATARQGRESAPRPLGQHLVEVGALNAEQVATVLRQQAAVMKVRQDVTAQNRPPTLALVEPPTQTQGIEDAPTVAQRFVGGVNLKMARQWVEKMLAAAVERGASDVHFHADERVRMRLHGALVPMTDKPLPGNVVRAGLSLILPIEDQQRLEVDGQADCAIGIPGVGRFRANIYQTSRGLDGVFRVVKEVPPTLQGLNLPSSLARLTTFHQGIVLCTGPAGSGKTSTMAALVAMINEERADHVVCIEDPIEVVHKSQRCIVNQRQAGKHTSGFARALKAALREDPDVIVIGEMRDRETASLALTAAETGHLVLATLHTHSAVRTINRVIGEFPPQQQSTIRAMLSESLRAIVSQRLMPKKDGTGVVPAVEVLYCTPAVANLIRDNRTHQIRSTMQTGSAQGMQTLDAALKDLVQRGVVAPEAALRHAEDPRSIEVA